MTLCRPSSSGDARAETRAQTTIDFAIGVSLFLIVVAFVVAFVPTIFAPFESAEGPQTADRIATSLSSDRLGDPAEPYLLNVTCTTGLFDQLNDSSDADPACRYNTSADTTAGLLALDSTQDANVSIHELDGGVATINGTSLAAGPALPETQSVTSAQRVVAIGGQTYRLIVRVW
ncbi:hypothetical protein D3D02_05450 [Halobellus sp. Atlit-38R]|uniref:DUF7287 family protein n=1 Tax=Halobellus sp. Atlit-38R TaxID=2282131 RepID=UPI000EF25066|nr:hypothetical protein [Halobellus sp. Atlit-38R]RLM90214.1 hypothetical protein D3D02_05450 [Halobellus sp. Atlit-38R]